MTRLLPMMTCLINGPYWMMGPFVLITLIANVTLSLLCLALLLGWLLKPKWQQYRRTQKKKYPRLLKPARYRSVMDTGTHPSWSALPKGTAVRQYAPFLSPYGSGSSSMPSMDDGTGFMDINPASGLPMSDMLDAGGDYYGFDSSTDMGMDISSDCSMGCDI